MVEGSVARSGEQLRVSARLVGVEDGSELWTRTFDRPLEDLFAVQRELADRVIAAVEQQTGWVIEIGGLRVRLWPARLVLQSLLLLSLGAEVARAILAFLRS